MIDLLSGEHVQAFIEQRKQKFGYNNRFLVLTPLNHVFCFWLDGSLSIFAINGYQDYQPEIAKLYSVEYDSNSDPYFRHPATRKHLYELFINDPGCMFFRKWYELEQEFRNRDLR